MSDLSLPVVRDWSAPELDAFVASWLLYRDVGFVDVVNHCRSGLAYLASPYTKRVAEPKGGFDPSASLECAIAAADWSRRFALDGVTAVSPVIQSVEMVHCDFMDTRLDPLDQRFWSDWRRGLLRSADYVIVPPVSGWCDSDGIWRDVRVALSALKPVFLIDSADDCGDVL